MGICHCDQRLQAKMHASRPGLRYTTMPGTIDLSLYFGPEGINTALLLLSALAASIGHWLAGDAEAVVPGWACTLVPLAESACVYYFERAADTRGAGQHSTAKSAVKGRAGAGGRKEATIARLEAKLRQLKGLLDEYPGE